MTIIYEILQFAVQKSHYSIALKTQSDLLVNCVCILPLFLKFIKMSSSAVESIRKGDSEWQKFVKIFNSISDALVVLLNFI